LSYRCHPEQRLTAFCVRRCMKRYFVVQFVGQNDLLRRFS